MPPRMNTSTGQQCAAPAMRKEFAEWILQGEHLMTAEVRYFIKCIRMEIEHQRELMSDPEKECAE